MGWVATGMNTNPILVASLAFQVFLKRDPGVSGELASVATSTEAVWTVWCRVQRVHEGVFSYLFWKRKVIFLLFFNTVDFGIVVIALPALWTMSSGIKYKQCCHSTQSHTCESWRNKSVAMKRHRIRVAVVFVCFLQYFFFFFFILLYMADTEWESVCRKQLNTVTYSATVHYCHHKFLFISFTTSFQLSGSFFFLLILFFSYKIIQSVSSREDIIDGISLIRLNVKQEGL